jgi:phage terminase large subunit
MTAKPTTSTNSFVYTTAIKKIRKLKKFVKGIQGGTSAGKTFGILPILIDIGARNPLSEISVVAESIPHLKRGAIKDFKKIMIQTGRWNPNNWNASDYKYTFYNGSVIEFFSADNDAKLRGARRDYLYMNECNNMTFHAYTELASRTKQGIYLDWNPTNEFWFHTELQNDSDVDFLIINYLDNEACPESALNFILKAKQKASTNPYWDNWYRVYGLGELGRLEGTIFQNWEVGEFQEIDVPIYGQDYGFSVDPTTLVKVSIDKANEIIYVKELMYQKGLSTKDIFTLTFQHVGNGLVIGDSAEPRLISELRKSGLNIKEAIKGQGSVTAGISLIQGYKMIIDKDSTNLIKELNNYQWLEQKSKTPIDDYNHCIDALRYAVTYKLKYKNSGQYNVY